MLTQQILREIDSNPVVIFSRSRCHACKSAEQKFKKLGVNPVVFELDRGKPEEMMAVLTILGDLTGETALPRVFIGGVCVRGEVAVAGQLKDLAVSAVKKHMKGMVLREIDANNAVIFSKSSCPFSAQAKRDFRDAGVDPAVVELDLGERWIASELKAALIEMTGRKTVPFVFIGGNFIGNDEQTAMLSRRGELKSVVEGAAARKEALTRVRETVLHEIARHPWLMFSKSFCQVCAEAKQALENFGLEHTIFELDLGDPQLADDVEALLGDVAGTRSVPLLFCNGSFVAGGTDIAVLLSSDQFDNLLSIRSST
eukprot:TRINITY_DN20369_c0_g1_i1.p1 TRINITY_DN20369_c0_g1~~TRINITY_DN20369_c0_g1_i1.p1  ORF type:complete len:368 (-),score=62.87 TRINITY_DN20369_c0_g1_i1:147-1085(-)